MDFVLDEKVDDEQALEMWGSVHPQMLGGEYLPDHLEDEVEVARIEMRSTTGDVLQVRARPLDGRIAYRVVDEYATEHGDPETWAYVIQPETSELPLTMGELVTLIDTTRQTGGLSHGDDRYDVGLIEGILNGNVADGSDPATMRHFFTVSSAFYPELGAYYDAVIQDWYDEELRFLDEYDSEYESEYDSE